MATSNQAEVPSLRNPFVDSMNRYTYSWEGYKSEKGEKYAQIKKIIQEATIDEILNQYNRLSFANLWNEPLCQLFKDEISERILSDATFTFMTVWRSLKDWLEKPFVSLHIGFEESYDIIDYDGEPVLENDPGANYVTVSNNQLSEEDQRNIIGLFLVNNNIEATVEYDMNDILITHVEKISLKTKISNVSSELIIPVTIYRSPDLHLLHLILDGIENKTYPIINNRSEIESLDWLNNETSTSLSNVEMIPLPPPEELVKKIQNKSEYANLWDKIHLTALKCATSESLAQYSIWIWDICKNLPCSECKYHMLQYILQNPPQDCVPSEEAREHIAFYWSWKFHNNVNARIDKPEVPYQIAFERYSAMI